MTGIKIDGTQNKVVLDDDADTYFEAATDDTIKVYVAGAQDFTITANTLTAESGSTIAAQALTATSITATGDISLDGGTFVFNESGADKDFRVESETSSHLLFADAGNDKVLIDSSNASTVPSRTLHVRSGDANVASFEGHQGEGLAISSGTDGQIDIIGYDDGASAYNKLIIRSNGSGNNIEVNTDGSVTMPLQPAFNVRQDGTQANLANDSTIQFPNETFDIGSNFASNTFTAPITGKYLFSFVVSVVQLDEDATYNRVSMNTSNRNYHFEITATQDFNGSDPSYKAFQGAMLVDMDASDTVSLAWSQSGGSSQADTFDSSYFSGVLVC